MKIEIDPTKSFTTVPVPRLVEAVGMIPGFAGNAYHAHPVAPTARQVFDHMMETYQFGFGDGTEMSVRIYPDGRWCSDYDEDEDLMPLVKLYWENVTIYLYSHALVAIVGPDTTLTTRMD